jgi:predicted nucleic acid-binding protein
MNERRGLLDTSVVVDLGLIDPSDLPLEAAVSTITLAELAAGVGAARDAHVRARRLEHLQRVEATFEPLPFDTAAARAYGRVYGAEVAAGRSSRRRVADLLIAATAVAAGLPLVTRNPSDVAGAGDLIEVVAV